MYCFFKQKTAYEMRISDWSSDVCSSDLSRPAGHHRDPDLRPAAGGAAAPGRHSSIRAGRPPRLGAPLPRPLAARRRDLDRIRAVAQPDRKSVVLGKSVPVRFALGGCCLIKKKINHTITLTNNIFI